MWEILKLDKHDGQEVSSASKMVDDDNSHLAAIKDDVKFALEKISPSTPEIEKIISTLNGDSANWKDAIIDGLMKVTINIAILPPNSTKPYLLTYPKFFIYARGHTIEEFVQAAFAEGKPKSKFLQKKIMEKIVEGEEDLPLPMDLVEVILKLNTRAREQANAVIKPGAAQQIPIDDEEDDGVLFDQSYPQGHSARSSSPVASSSNASD